MGHVSKPGSRTLWLNDAMNEPMTSRIVEPDSRRALLGAWDLSRIVWGPGRPRIAPSGLLLHLVDGTFSLHIAGPRPDGHHAEHGVFVMQSPGRVDHRIENSSRPRERGLVRRYRSSRDGPRLILESLDDASLWKHTVWTQ